MKPNESQTFYRWVDRDGRLHIVSSPDAVPVGDRPKATSVVVDGVDTYTSPTASRWKLDYGSFAAGFGVALLVWLLLRLVPGSGRWLSRVGFVVGIGALVMAAYLGLLRRATGMPGASALATPSALIEDARSAVEQMNQRQQRQEQEIKQIQAEGR